ncbi:MFS transporter [Streptacidiphilus rugosus]|uniref:MFS transporter n=1 Tax=Streptacidiphilus rugosus TaxID=405783 RepID=UPI00068ABABA|nr:MFS transporter [Streptacidiphilus rugosus]
MAELTPAGTRLSEALLPPELAPRERLRTPALSRWNALRGVRVGLTVAVLLLLLTGANLATPLYPALQARLGLTPVDTTLLFTAYVFAVVPVLAAVGHWSDRLGRRALVLPAVALAAAGDAVFASAGTLGELALGRAVQGLAVGLATGAAGAALADLLPDRPSLAAKLTLAASAGGVALGPLLGAALARGADPLVTPFAVHAVALLALCVPLALLHPRSPGHYAVVPPRISLRPRALSLPRRGRAAFLLAAAAGFVSYAVFGVYLSLAPGYAALLLHTRNPLGGAGVAALLLGSSAVAQLLARPTRSRAVPALGMAGLALGLGLVVLAGGAQSPALLFAGSVLAGGCQGLAFRTLFTTATAAMEPEHRGSQLSALWVVVYMGSSLPTIAVGFLARAYGILPAVSTFAAVAATACIALAAASLRVGTQR